METAEAERQDRVALEVALKRMLTRKRKARKACKGRQFARGRQEDAHTIKGVASTRWAKPPSIPDNYNPNDKEESS
jgi:hypothetical protein